MVVSCTWAWCLLWLTGTDHTSSRYYKKNGLRHLTPNYRNNGSPERHYSVADKDARCHEGNTLEVTVSRDAGGSTFAGNEDACYLIIAIC